MKKYQYDKEELSLLERACVPLAIYQYIDKRIVTLAISDGFLDLFEIPDRESAIKTISKDLYYGCHPDDLAMLENAAHLFASTDQPYNIVYRTRIGGRYKILHARGTHVQKGGAKLEVVWFSDEGEYQKEGEQKGDFLAAAYSNLLRANTQERLLQYDYLTGFPTISHFFYMCDTVFYPKSLEAGETPIMLFFDMSGMRRFNAKYGYAEGDKLIHAFARLLAQTFSNECCSRFGMDRFCVYTNDKDLEKRLWQFFSDCEQINGGRSLPVRAGIYSKNIEVCSASFACDRAKMACDSGKGAFVSNFTWFEKSMLVEAEKRQYIVENIDRAIAEKWIKVYYQPIIRAANGKVCDEEALARWIDPQKGFLSPVDFIPILEDSGLIYKLDLFMLEEILKKLEEQKKAGLYLAPVSVNLSRSDFDSCDIVQEIYQRVQKTSIPLDKITIEITESILGGDFDYMKSQIKRFKDLGFKVWLDDFGSGYSSLEVLHDVPFDLIKFDMKFMREFERSEKCKIMLSGLIKIAAELGLETVCEGVETEEQVEFLKEIGCVKLQGYYYCKPIPLEEIFERYKKDVQIGFENPDESEYYAKIGSINLYNISSITNSSDQIYKNVFNTPPMVIFEATKSEIKIVRGNKSYKEFVKKNFRRMAAEGSAIGKIIYINEANRRRNALFFEVIRKCSESSEPVIVDQELSDGSNAHIFIRRVSVNPVTKVVALAAIIFSVSDIK